MVDQPKVGSVLRIRIPNDFVVAHGPALKITPVEDRSDPTPYTFPVEDRRPMTMEEYNDRILSQAIRRFAECQVYETLTRESHKLDLFFYNDVIPKRSWWRRRLDAVRDFGCRVRDAWSVLTGKAQVYDDDY